MKDQTFVFNRSLQSVETWKEFEVSFFNLLSKTFHTKSETIQSFERAARLNKPLFLKEVKKLLDKHKLVFTTEVKWQTKQLIKDTIIVADRHIKDIEDKAKHWKAPEVVKHTEFATKQTKPLHKTRKVVDKDINNVTGNVVKLVGNRYSFISRNIVSNVKKLESGEINYSTIRKEITKQLSMEAHKGVPTIIDKGGRVLDIVNYSEMSVRANYKQLFNETLHNRYEEYGIDLVVSNVLADSSSICQEWQGGVYARGESKQYQSASLAEEAGHTTHIGCRHMWFPYIHNVSTKPAPVDSKTIKHNREARQKQRYNERQIRKWKRIHATDHTDFSKQKVANWQKAQRTHMSNNKQMSRMYEREQI